MILWDSEGRWTPIRYLSLGIQISSTFGLGLQDCKRIGQNRVVLEEVHRSGWEGHRGDKKDMQWKRQS